MHEIQIRYLVPLHDYVTLVIFEDKTRCVTDCKLLKNVHSELMPSLNPGLLDGTAQVPCALSSVLEEEIGQSEFREITDGEVVELEIDPDLYRDFGKWCHTYNISREKIIQALFYFFIEEHKLVVDLWFADMRRRDMAKALQEAKLHQYTQSQIEQDFDAAMEEVECGRGPILIKANNGHECLLFEWNDYWERFGWLHEPGERQRIEEECRKSAAESD